MQHEHITMWGFSQENVGDSRQPQLNFPQSNMVKNSTVQEFSKSLCLISASENSEVASSETTQIRFIYFC